jgi:large subunit ribosomal protein L3
MIGLLGKKLGQTRVYDDNGKLTSVTVVLAGPNRVVQKKTEETDGYNAVQLGFDDQKEQRVNKPQTGHFAKHKAAPVKRLKEFRDFTLDVNPGDVIGPDIFEQGDYIDAIGVTKGRGFQGAIKRHNFAKGRRTHGSKGFKRRTGAIGACADPGTIDKGKKMPGHMGQVRRTNQNLKVIQVRKDDNVLLISGAIPGANGDYVIIRESKKRPKKS